MITAIRIENLRSLKDTGYIQIKPLTILLGANSSKRRTEKGAYQAIWQRLCRLCRDVLFM